MGEALAAIPMVLGVVSQATKINDNLKGPKDTTKEARKRLQEHMANEEKNKTNLVQKALATQRAKYGAAGASGRGMTEEAVLKRLRAEVEQPFDERKKDDLLQLKKLKKPKRNIFKNILANITQAFSSIPSEISKKL
ncbi:MAG: hypothetical protein LBR41_02290 [Rickettsiales bacterium]|jgi:hypothetical protein|nr:hypothetical protein [Rickettsiales bacterium]